MMKFLVKKNEYNQIIIFGTIVRYNTISKSTMAAQLSCNPHTFARYIRNINNDFVDVFPKVAISIQSNGDTLTLERPTELSKTNLVKVLSEKYLETSTIYQLLQLLLVDKNDESVDFLNTLNISQSYLNKIIIELNTHFKATGVKIKQRNQSAYFAGEPIHLISLSFLLRNYLEHFGSLMPASDSENHNLTSQPSSLKTLYATFKTHVYASNKVTIKNKGLKKLLVHLFENDPQFTQDYDFSEFNDDSHLLFNLLAHLTVSPLDNTSSKAKLGEQLSKVTSPLIKDTKKLTEQVTAEFSLDLPPDSLNYQQYFYIITIHLIYLRLLNYNFKELFHFSDKDLLQKADDFPKIYEMITDYFNIKKNFNQLSRKHKALIVENNALFIETTYSLTRFKNLPTVTISCNFIHRVAFGYFIEKYLQTVFSPTIIKFVSVDTVPDILISDHIIDADDETNLFIFADTNSTIEMGELLNLVIVVMNKKIISHA